jgi:hypothetical protein
MLDSFLTYSSALKMKAVSISETPTNIYPTTQYYIPEHNVLHSNHYETLSIFNMQCWHYVVIYFDPTASVV